MECFQAVTDLRRHSLEMPHMKVMGQRGVEHQTFHDLRELWVRKLDPGWTELQHVWEPGAVGSKGANESCSPLEVPELVQHLQ